MRTKVKAWDTGRHFVIWCEICRRYHYHGRIEGSRVSHCIDRAAGPEEYELELVGPAPRGMLRDLKRRRPLGPPWCL